MSTTSQGSSAVINAIGGFAQKVPNPSEPSSNQLAAYYPALNAVLVPITFGTTSYSFFLPQGSFIFQVLYAPDVAFTTGAFNLGTTVGGSQLLSGISLTSGSINTLPVPMLSGTTQNLYITITGSPAVGNGNMVIVYFPTAKAPVQN